MEPEYIKCSGCKCLRHIVDEYEIYKGTRRKNCLKCKEKRNKNKINWKCEHGRLKYSSKECGGSGNCEHGNRKITCKECGGSQICEHNRVRSKCVDCDGGSICEHKHHKDSCVKCKFIEMSGDEKAIYLESKKPKRCKHGITPSSCYKCNSMVHFRQMINRKPMQYLQQHKRKTGLQYLGCTTDEYIKYVESLFIEGISWENYKTKWDMSIKVPWYDNENRITGDDEILANLELIEESLNYKNTCIYVKLIGKI